MHWPISILKPGLQSSHSTSSTPDVVERVLLPGAQLGTGTTQSPLAVDSSDASQESARHAFWVALAD